MCKWGNFSPQQFADSHSTLFVWKPKIHMDKYYHEQKHSISFKSRKFQGFLLRENQYLWHFKVDVTVAYHKSLWGNNSYLLSGVQLRKKKNLNVWDVLQKCNHRKNLSPLLFIIVLEVLSREFCSGVLWEDHFADDIVIIAESLKECVRKLLTWKGAVEEKGLRVNAGKTKIMICGTGLDLLQS